MVDTTRVVNYLRRIGALEGKPRYEEQGIKEVCIDPRGHWDEYYGNPMFWKQVPFDFHKEEFENIDSNLPSLSRETIQQRALDQIPDSRDTVMIDLGSRYGERGAGYLAKFKPNVRTILIDKGWDEEKPKESLFIEPPRRLKYVLRFRERSDLLYEENLEKKVNGLYHSNGMKNVEFHQKRLDPKNIRNIFSSIRGKEIYLFGHQAPITLPFTIGEIYNEFDAKAMWVSPSGLEKADASEFSWGIIQKNLGLTDNELAGLVESTYDHKAAAEKNSFSFKYNYKYKKQERVGKMIKLAIAAALAIEVDGNIYNDTEANSIEKSKRHNKPSHYVTASRS